MTTFAGWAEKVRPYVQIARVDHWFKNIFILPGMIAVMVFEPDTKTLKNVPFALLALLSACLIASSNYVINEILDARTDRFHPFKKSRPLVSGRAKLALAYGEWLGLALCGLGVGAFVSGAFVLTLAGFWVMGIVYNVPPLRSKEAPYLDVLSEAINNPIRLLLGWFGMRGMKFPPSSLLMAYWLIGAYLMTAKRFAEYREIGDPERAASYRSSFRFYTEAKLATTMLAYASGFMFFVGVILVKYHVEFILACPLLMVYLAYYSGLAYKENSVAQNPERLYRDKTLMGLTIALAVVLWVLAFTKIPALGAWLGIEGRGW